MDNVRASSKVAACVPRTHGPFREGENVLSWEYSLQGKLSSFTSDKDLTFIPNYPRNDASAL